MENFDPRKRQFAEAECSPVKKSKPPGIAVRVVPPERATLCERTDPYIRNMLDAEFERKKQLHRDIVLTFSSAEKICSRMCNRLQRYLSENFDENVVCTPAELEFLDQFSEDLKIDRQVNGVYKPRDIPVTLIILNRILSDSQNKWLMETVPGMRDNESNELSESFRSSQALDSTSYVNQSTTMPLKK